MDEQQSSSELPKQQSLREALTNLYQRNLEEPFITAPFLLSKETYEEKVPKKLRKVIAGLETSAFLSVALPLGLMKTGKTFITESLIPGIKDARREHEQHNT